MISLNIKSVTDEIFALTALRSSVTSTPTDRYPPVLTRDNLPALRVMIRSAFATLVTRLLPYIPDAQVDEGNPAAPRPYDDKQPVTLGLDPGERASALTAGAMMALKRHLEHILALTVLEKAYLPLDSAISAEHASEAAKLLTTVTTLLADAASPRRLIPWNI